ncbi:MAG: SMC family ATPase [Clostridia bacterium]|nr:SMC family ATPase [Clostridia bacterium]
MKPIKMTVSAFGPYSGKTEIDFERLGECGIYLITGDTGAGKTTIFDAISFALFGEASGDNREPAMLRSKYALPNVPTYVELEFVSKGKVYRVKRNPDYERPRERGEGMTVEKADAELTYPDGRAPVTKSREVTKAIIELLGFDRNQFTQIAMIAQGDFMKLLTADTENRGKILRDIFKTKVYADIQESIKKFAREIGSRYEILQKSTAQYISGIRIGEASAYIYEADRIKELLKNSCPFDDAVLLLESVIKEDSDTVSEVDKKIAGLNEKVKEIDTLYGIAETLEKSLAEITRLSAERETAVSEVEKAKKEYGEKILLTENVVKLNDRIALLKATGDKYGVQSRLKEVIFELNKKLTSSNGIVSSLQKKKESYEKSIELLKKEQAEIKGSDAKLSELKNNFDAHKRRREELKNIHLDLQRYRVLIDEWKKLVSEYEEAAGKSDKAKAEYDIAERLFLDAQAGILAKKLRNGEKCPVCGSVHHPEPAMLCGGAPSEDDVKIKKMQYEKAHKAVIDLSEKANGKKVESESLWTRIKDVSKEFVELDAAGLTDAVIKAGTAEKNAMEQLASQIETCEKNVKRFAEIESELPKDETELSKVTEAISSAGAEIAAYTAQLSETEKQLSDINETLEYESRDALEKAISEIAGEKVTLEKNIELSKTALEKSEKHLNALNASIEALEKNTVNSAACTKEELSEQRRVLKTEIESLSEIRDKASSRLDSNNVTLKSIKSNLTESKKTEQQYQMAATLSNTANGTVTGKEKINLETYVQSTYFERIIRRANILLMDMSGGQFELKRRGKADNFKNKSGLELDVIDHYNGSERSVKTLSGGESFKAALSLALGLSNEIQSMAGGIQIDSMFIDEGFGSLDSESLDQAIKVLNRLSDGNRIVGIISHVEELKTRIEKQIVVTKDKTGGSNVNIVV